MKTKLLLSAVLLSLLSGCVVEGQHGRYYNIYPLGYHHYHGHYYYHHHHRHHHHRHHHHQGEDR